MSLIVFSGRMPSRKTLSSSLYFGKRVNHENKPCATNPDRTRCTPCTFELLCRVSSHRFPPSKPERASVLHFFDTPTAMVPEGGQNFRNDRALSARSGLLGHPPACPRPTRSGSVDAPPVFTTSPYLVHSSSECWPRSGSAFLGRESLRIWGHGGIWTSHTRRTSSVRDALFLTSTDRFSSDPDHESALSTRRAFLGFKSGATPIVGDER